MDASDRELNERIALAVDLVRARRLDVPMVRPVMVAVSGIDASGKGHVSRLLMIALGAAGLRAQLVGADDWLALPAVRFAKEQPAERFYEHGIRFAELVRQVLAPLRTTRSWRTTIQFLAETGTAFEAQECAFEAVDVVVVEGVFLCRRDLRAWFDLRFWVECSFATALQRAVQRAQEGLGAAATAAAYRSIYFPAQLLHFARDAPRAAADLVIPNDPAQTSHVATPRPSDGHVASW